jgi:predicted outer membrane protein
MSDLPDVPDWTTMDGIAFATQTNACESTDDFTVAETLELTFSIVAEEAAMKTATHNNEPQTFAEAMLRPAEEASKWYQASVDEIQAMVLRAGPEFI